jgi:hypothetical protein
MSSIFQKIFGPAPAAAPAPTNNVNTNPPPQQQTQQSQQTAPNGVVPADTNPMEKFKDIWEAPKVDPNAPANQQSEPVTAEKMMEAAGKVDFAKVITPEQLAAIGQGGDGAVQAFGQALNKVAQTVYGQSAYATTRIVEQAVSQAEQKFAAQLPSLINNQSSKQTLLAENKQFQDPAVKPVFDLVHTQMTTKFPNATTVEVNEMVKEMLKGMADVFNPEATKQAVAAKTPKVNAAEDFSDYV